MKTQTIKSLSLLLAALQVQSLCLAGAGATTANFLKVSPDSRSAAMGDTGTADASSGFAAFHNPAITAAANARLSFSGSQTQWLLGTQISHYAAAGRWENDGARWGLAATMSQLSSPSFDATDAQGNGLGQASFKAQTAGLAVSRSWGENFSVGAGVKKISESFQGGFGAKSSALAYDAGLFAQGSEGRWSAGAVLANAGSAAGFGDSKEPLPTAVRAGLEVAPGDKSFSWTFEASHQDTGFAFAAGMGFHPFKNLSLRAGYNSQVAGAKYAGLTSGLGFSFGDLTLDYAFTPFGDMGNVQRISVSWALGGASRSGETPSRRAARNGERRTYSYTDRWSADVLRRGL